jgi:dGTPase
LLEHPDEMPASFHERIAVEGLERVVCDYLAGMTDRFLRRLAGANGTYGD